MLLTDFAFDLRIAFRLFELVLDLLLGHHQILRRLPRLISVVGNRQHHDHRDDLKRQREDDIRDLLETRAEVVVDEVRHVGNLILDVEPDEKSDDDDLENRFEHLDQRTLGENPSEAVDRIEIVELRFELFSRDDQPDLHEIDPESDDHYRKHDRQ